MTNMEIERKWLIDINNIPYNLNDYDHLDIEQAYISFSPTIRIRKIENKNEYILTIKSSSIDGGLSRQEYEIAITKNQYESLLTKKEGNVLSKTRYIVFVDEHKMEIDIFHGALEGFGYMEIEFESDEKAKAYKSPDWVVKELTYDSRYSNASLAKGNIDILLNNKN